MCGIVGYVGDRDCANILLDGLRRLEYRGYDSAGIAIICDGNYSIRRAEGKMANLASRMAKEPIAGAVGIGHTRWATHGRPSEHNAHPHRAGDIVVVHNGIIENHSELRAELGARGHTFKSETDTEIVAHLVQDEVRAGREFPEAVRLSLARVRGSFAVGVLCLKDPQTMVGARYASPMIVGLGKHEHFLASDIPAILAHTRRIVTMEDGDMAVLRPSGVEFRRLADGSVATRPEREVTWSPAMAEKGGYKHFMLKEIHEQPRALADTLRGRALLDSGEVWLEGAEMDAAAVGGISRLVIVACGTSFHAGLVGKYLIESISRIPVEVDLASEFRYRGPILDSGVLAVAISQSGETLDTLMALREARAGGAKALSIVNVVESSIARESDLVFYTHAGPEIGVASTKAFTTQIAALYMLAVHLGVLRGRLERERAKALLGDLVAVPALMDEMLRDVSWYERVARRYHTARNMLYLGRGPLYPIALEGALKLKEISYIHAEGYAAGEMKHGPIALIDEDVPTVLLCLEGPHYDKVASNMQEIRARRGPVIAVATHGDAEIAGHADEVFYLPRSPQAVQPLLAAVVMQLIAYYTADRKGTDVDQPRNLAKSVTVE